MVDFGKKIILGSASPRRKWLLDMAGIPCTVRTSHVDEVYDVSMPVSEVAEYLAHKKSTAFEDLGEDEIVITADSIVVCDGRIYEKPSDREDAVRILSELSGKVHLVYTGVCLKTRQRLIRFTDITRVEFAALTQEEISHYIDAHRPFDKAGSYGIQDWLGMCKVRSITGSYPNVMGLPVHRVYEELRRI